MAYFECIIGGAGTTLTVTCDSVFAGKTITCTNGTTTLTAVCPSASPYVVEFDVKTDGTWTISGTVNGKTHSTSITINTSATLHEIPTGSSVTPVANVQTWLHCANIWNKSYTTIAQVLADASTLQALIASNNAADYMARSTSWASAVTANSSAMTYIGANNYCANKLLADSTWLNAICNSTYFESVLNVKVPTMTSNTTPSGVASCSNDNSRAYTLFDNNDGTGIETGQLSGSIYGQYQFTQNYKIRKCKYVVGNFTPSKIVISASNDGSNFVQVHEQTVSTSSGEFGFISNVAYKIWRATAYFGSGGYMRFYTFQFYGRA